MKRLIHSPIFDSHQVLPLITVLLVAGLLSIVNGQTTGEETTKEKKVQSEISIRISADKKTYHPGDVIKLHVEIWNVGDKSLFIYKTLEGPDNALSKLRLLVSRDGGFKGSCKAWASAGDSFAAYRKDHPPLAAELSREWLPLAPNHFYGKEVEVPAWKFCNWQTGTYRIQGEYYSDGFLSQNINNGLVPYAEELAQLPYRSWTGEIESNTLGIEILKPTPQKRRP